MPTVEKGEKKKKTTVQDETTGEVDGEATRALVHGSLSVRASNQENTKLRGARTLKSGCSKPVI